MFCLDEQRIFENLNKEYTLEAFLLALNKDYLNELDFAALICADIDEVLLETLAVKARKITLKRFGRVKGLYIPLYISNFCNSSCIYCGFRNDNQIPRKTLTLNQIEQELIDIYKKGFRNILLVSGEWSSENKYFLESIDIARKIGFHSIAVEIGSFSEEFCRKLVNSGAESFVLYQETYNQGTYQKVHLRGQKTDYQYRLDSQERALLAGFRKVIFGFLGGLFNPKFEALAMFEHIKYIRRKFWNCEIGISIPRITNAKGVDINKFKIDNIFYARILMVFRLAFPDIIISLSTREKENFRDGMADICITNLSVESKTMPGGYHNKNKNDLEQFTVVDGRSMQSIINILKLKGYDIHVKDWEQSLNKTSANAK